MQRKGFSAEALTLTTTGRILRDPVRSIAGHVAFGTKALDFGDPDLQVAMGERVVGGLQVRWSENAPLELRQMQIDGETYSATGRADVTWGEDGPDTAGAIRLAADDIRVFSGLADRKLSGQATLEVAFDAAPLAGSFDVTASGTTNNLTIDHAEADRILNGVATLRATASRDKTGLKLEISQLETPQAQLTVNGMASSTTAQASFTAKLSDVSILASDLAGPAMMTGQLEQSGDEHVAVSIVADGPGGSTLSVNGDVTRDIAMADLNLKGSVPLGLANRFISPQSLSGQALFDLTLEGPLDLSSLSGQIQSTGARYVAPELGYSFNEISVTAKIFASNASISASTRVDTGGIVRMSGNLGLTGQLTSDLKADLTSVVLTDPRLFETTVNGTVTVVGPLASGALIAGDLSLGQTNVQIPSTGLGGAGDIPEVIHINEPPPVRGTRRRAGLLDTQNSGSGGKKSFPAGFANSRT